MSDADIQKAGRDLLKLTVAYLVDLRGGQVKIPMDALVYGGSSVRFALQDDNLILTLMTNEHAEATRPDGVPTID